MFPALSWWPPRHQGGVGLKARDPWEPPARAATRRKVEAPSLHDRRWGWSVSGEAAGATWVVWLGLDGTAQKVNTVDELRVGLDELGSCLLHSFELATRRC